MPVEKLKWNFNTKFINFLSGYRCILICMRPLCSILFWHKIPWAWIWLQTRGSHFHIRNYLERNAQTELKMQFHSLLFGISLVSVAWSVVNCTSFMMILFFFLFFCKLKLLLGFVHEKFFSNNAQNYYFWRKKSKVQDKHSHRGSQTNKMCAMKNAKKLRR